MVIHYADDMSVRIKGNAEELVEVNANVAVNSFIQSFSETNLKITN